MLDSNRQNEDQVTNYRETDSSLISPLEMHMNALEDVSFSQAIHLLHLLDVVLLKRRAKRNVTLTRLSELYCIWPDSSTNSKGFSRADCAHGEQLRMKGDDSSYRTAGYALLTCGNLTMMWCGTHITLCTQSKVSVTFLLFAVNIFGILVIIC